MNITQILLGSTAAMLLAALILSYGAMRNGEAGDSRRQSAVELMQENARLQAEIDRLRSGQPIAAPIQPMEKPDSVSKEELRTLKERNQLLAEQNAELERKRKQAEEETLAMNEHKAQQNDKEARRGRLISQAMLMAQVKETAQQEGIYVIVIDVKQPQSVQLNTKLAIRRGRGIIGRLVVSHRDDETGVYFADPIPGSFPGGKVDVQVGDELIIPPFL